MLHLRATNSSVKMFLLLDFLLPLQLGQGSIRKPPHFEQSEMTEGHWREICVREQ